MAPTFAISATKTFIPNQCFFFLPLSDLIMVYVSRRGFWFIKLRLKRITMKLNALKKFSTLQEIFDESVLDAKIKPLCSTFNNAFSY